MCIFYVAPHLQVAALTINGWLDPPDQGPEEYYFPLREGAIDSATRAVFSSGESAKDLVTFRINFAADGVETLMPDILWVRPGGGFTRCRLYGKLRRSLTSLDGVPLYAMLEEQPQIM